MAISATPTARMAEFVDSQKLRQPFIPESVKKVINAKPKKIHIPIQEESSFGSASGALYSFGIGTKL